MDSIVLGFRVPVLCGLVLRGFSCNSFARSTLICSPSLHTAAHLLCIFRGDPPVFGAPEGAPTQTGKPVVRDGTA
jgi:hypothetical protein